MNVKILGDSKSNLQVVSLHFETHTKCFPRSLKPTLANHSMPMDLGCHVFWSGLKGRMTKMRTWLSLAHLCSPNRPPSKPTTHQPNPTVRPSEHNVQRIPAAGMKEKNNNRPTVSNHSLPRYEMKGKGEGKGREEGSIFLQHAQRRKERKGKRKGLYSRETKKRDKEEGN